MTGLREYSCPRYRNSDDVRISRLTYVLGIINQRILNLQVSKCCEEKESGIDILKIRVLQKVETQASDVGSGVVGVVDLCPRCNKGTVYGLKRKYKQL